MGLHKQSKCARVVFAWASVSKLGVGGLSPWHCSIYVSEIVCVSSCSMNQSSAVIVRLIVRYIPVGLEALLSVIYVCMCKSKTERAHVKGPFVHHINLR